MNTRKLYAYALKNKSAQTIKQALEMFLKDT